MIYEYKPQDRVYSVQLQKRHYFNGRIALSLIDASDGSPIAHASTNIPEQELKDDEICTKTWSENKGMFEFLLKNKIAEDTGKTYSTGYIKSAPICRIIVKIKSDDE